jgi:hypothetical protein
VEWFEEEPQLASSWSLAKRLVVRARASWRVWIPLALLVGAGAAFMRSRSVAHYETTVFLRVTESHVALQGSQLGKGVLHAHLDELVFTGAHLTEVMRHYPRYVRQLNFDAATALDDFRHDFTINVVDGDFTEDRMIGDPPRTARIEITAAAGDPEDAYQLAHDLADLVVGSTLGRQKEALEREQAAARAAAAQAATEMEAISAADPTQDAPLTKAARERIIKTKQREAAAMLALRALSEQQALRFDVIDPGVVAPPRRKITFVLTGVLVILGVALMALLLLAGALDPRILNFEDVTSLGIPVLGQLQALPRGRTEDRPGRV